MARTLPLYVQNFQTAYENLYKLYLSKETFTHIDKNVTKTKEFIQYAKAVKEVIQVKMNTGNKKKSNDIEGPNQSSNKAMVESLRASGEYNYYKIDYSSGKKTSSSANSDEYAEENENWSDTTNESDETIVPNESDNSMNNMVENNDVFFVDEVLDHLFSDILRKDVEKCFFLSKGDAWYAFNSISLCTHNELVDMCRKLPKPIPIYSPKDGDGKVCYKMVHLDDTVVDSQGNTELLGAITADPNRDPEYEAIYSAILTTYGITSFVHEMVADFIKNNKLFEMLEYLHSKRLKFSRWLLYANF